MIGSGPDYYYFSDYNGNSLKDGKEIVMKTTAGDKRITDIKVDDVETASYRSDKGGIRNDPEDGPLDPKIATRELTGLGTVTIGKSSRQGNMIIRTKFKYAEDEKYNVNLVYYYEGEGDSNKVTDEKNETKKLFETLLKYGIIG